MEWYILWYILCPSSNTTSHVSVQLLVSLYYDHLEGNNVFNSSLTTVVLIAYLEKFSLEIWMLLTLPYSNCNKEEIIELHCGVTDRNEQLTLFVYDFISPYLHAFQCDINIRNLGIFIGSSNSSVGIVFNSNWFQLVKLVP